MATSPVRAISIRPCGPDHALEGVDLLVRPGHLDGQAAARDIDDLRPEDLRELHDLGAALHRRLNPEQGHLPGDRLLRLHVADLDHVDQLVELLGHLVDRVDRAVQGQRDPRDVGVVGRAHGERVDVEAAAAEQARRSGPGRRACSRPGARGCACARSAPRPTSRSSSLIRSGRAGFHARSAHHVPRRGSGRDHREAVLGLARPARRAAPGRPSRARSRIASSSSSLSSQRMPVQPKASASFTQSGLSPISTD